MNIWKHKDWQTFKGTWLIASCVLSDKEIIALITDNPDKYGSVYLDWSKVK